MEKLLDPWLVCSNFLPLPLARRRRLVPLGCFPLTSSSPLVGFKLKGCNEPDFFLGGIINFAHIDGKDNPADVLTKNRSPKEWFALLKPLIFWRSDSKNAEMAPMMVATLSRGVMFSRLLRPHPRVLGASVCASTRCSLAGLSSGFPCIVAIVATSSLFENNCSSYLFSLSLSYPFDSFNY